MECIDLLPKVKIFNQTLSEQFTALERRLSSIIFQAETIYSSKIQAVKNLPAPAPQLIPLSHVHWSAVDQSGLDQKMSKEWSQLRLEDRISETPAMANIRRAYEDLESMELKLCFLSFSIFPDGSMMKKGPLIYWWIGKGFITSTQKKTAEEVGEDIFENLMRKGLISQTGSNESSCPFVKSCVMNPWIRRMMPSYDTSTCRRACLVFNNQIRQGDDGPKVDDLLTVFNVNDQYLGLKKEWLSKLEKVAVLQLGRWQDLATRHIEVEFANREDVGFLKGLGAQNKHLKGLTSSRPCKHSKVVSSSLKNTPCRLGLAKLKNLKRLRINMGNEALVQKGELNKLEDISSLRHLKISWGGDSLAIEEQTAHELAFLPNLEKLDVQGIPVEHVPKWLNPGQLGNLKKLYIRGGELSSLDHGETDAKGSFPLLPHSDLEDIHCHEVKRKRVI
ncbi:disease resistance RPP13-like protein 4 [Pyrus ussuriensis x Pyrus communis]|uniref:Disease resistance RPP13-like protein 4 n=1 Tax=Pyrus ussuriensis x Pyrus communis TaxID=2448454 RepID=A0A5N5G8I1_9ROSA|nr:disease resistance RPP13-like protein 4 [Pyrus ussuriensis x Pyrus communis]